MTDKLPSDWAIKAAIKESGLDYTVAKVVQESAWPRTKPIIALARRIEATDEPPLSIEEQAIRHAMRNVWSATYPQDVEQTCAEAIEKYKELSRG